MGTGGRGSAQAGQGARGRAVVPRVAQGEGPRLCQQKKDDACAKAELDKALETSTGEELRETLELGDLLASFGRKKDALQLLRSVSEESEQKNNTELHLRTARLAKELKDEVTVKAACTRALSNGQSGLKCP